MRPNLDWTTSFVPWRTPLPSGWNSVASSSSTVVNVEIVIFWDEVVVEDVNVLIFFSRKEYIRLVKIRIPNTTWNRSDVLNTLLMILLVDVTILDNSIASTSLCTSTGYQWTISMISSHKSSMSQFCQQGPLPCHQVLWPHWERGTWSNGYTPLPLWHADVLTANRPLIHTCFTYQILNMDDFSALYIS